MGDEASFPASVFCEGEGTVMGRVGSAQLLDFNTHVFYNSPVATLAVDIIINMETDLARSSSLCWMSSWPSGSTGHPDLYGPSSSIILGFMVSGG